MLLTDIKSIRQEQKITRYQLSQITALKQSTIQNIEEGKVSNPGVFTIMKIFVALNLDMNNLKEA